MKYEFKSGKQILTVEIIQESEKFLTLRTIQEDGTVKEFRKKKPVALTPIEEPEKENVQFNKWITEPFQHQIDFLQYAQTHDKFLLLDDPGLGKTKQALDLIYNRIESGQIKRALVVCCVGGLQYNWLNEVKKHTTLKGYILGTRPAKKNSLATKIGSNKDKVEDLKAVRSDILICNIEALRNSEITMQLQLMIARKEIGQIVVDEIHKCKNSSAKQTENLYALHPPYKLGLTGTPVINTPLDLYGVANWLGEELRSFSTFKDAYCVMGGFKNKEVIGYKNLDELAMRLSQYSLHRIKDQCVDLPEKTLITSSIDLLPSQRTLYAQVLSDIRDRPEDILTLPTPMGRFIGLRKVTGCPIEAQESYNPYDCSKAEEVRRLVEEAVANNQKVVIFTWFVFTLQYLNTYLQSFGYKPATIYGEMSLEERLANQRAFQYNPECKVILGNYQTMGTGIELTAASLVIEYEMPWTAADEQQAQDRCHRIGQTKNLTCIRLVNRGTIDERVQEIVDMKIDLSNKVVNRAAMLSIIQKSMEFGF